MMRMPLLTGISARSRTSTKGAKTVNVVSDRNNQIAQKRPALVYSEGYGGLGSGLMDTPRGLFSAWDGTVVDEVGCARILAGGSFVEVDITGYTDVYLCGMSDDGSVCCGYGTRTSDAKIRALRITVDGVTELAYPSGITGFTWAYGISGDGQTIVGAGKPSSVGMRSYMWKDGAVTEIARANDLTTSVEGGAMSASYDGNVIVGWHFRSGIRKGYVYKVDTATLTYQTLTSPYSASTQVKFFCVSSDGEWIGGNAAEYPIIWNHERNILGDINNGTYGFVTGVSNKGKYACGTYVLQFNSFFYERTVYQFDNSDPWEATRPYAVGNQVTNDSDKVYTCVTEGTTAPSGGPTGTGSGITDGTVVWDYVGLATDVVSPSVLTLIEVAGAYYTYAYSISRYGNSVFLEVTDSTGVDLFLNRWNQCGGVFKDIEELGAAPPGSGIALSQNFPKGSGLSGMGGHVGAVSVNPTTYTRIPLIWVPSE